MGPTAEGEHCEQSVTMSFQPLANPGERADKVIEQVACNGATRTLEKRGVVVPQLPSTCPLSLDDLFDPEFDPETAIQTLSAAIQAVTKHSI